LAVADEDHTIFGHTIVLVVYLHIKIFNRMILAVIFVCQYSIMQLSVIA